MQKENHGTNRLSVLVVDDDRAISKVIKRNLEDGDTEVFEATTGFDCIRICNF